MHQRIQNGSAISQSSRAFTPRRNRAQKEQHRCDRIRVLQLAVCLLLFFLVAVGNGVCPDKMERIGEQIRVLTTQDVDLRAAFSRLGESVVGEESSLHQLQEFCEEVFEKCIEKYESLGCTVSYDSETLVQGGRMVEFDSKVGTIRITYSPNQIVLNIPFSLLETE